MINTIVSSSFLILMLLLLRAVFRGRISPALQYGFWGLVWVRLLLGLLPGVVTLSGFNERDGNFMEIRHQSSTETFYTYYAHLASLSVSEGAAVTAGQSIGIVGSTGKSNGPHLHLEVRLNSGNGNETDPAGYYEF